MGLWKRYKGKGFVYGSIFDADEEDDGVSREITHRDVSNFFLKRSTWIVASMLRGSRKSCFPTLGE